MDSNTYSVRGSAWPVDRYPPQPPDELDELTALLDRLAARDLDRLTDVARAERILRLRPLVHRLEGQWLKELAGVDARGAAGAEQDRQFGPTASWLRARLRMTTTSAAAALRTARALFRGPLPASGTALMAGGDLGGSCGGAGRQHPAPARPRHPSGRSDPAGLGPLPGPGRAAPGGHLLGVHGGSRRC